MFKKMFKNKKGSAMVFTVVLLFNALAIVASMVFISAMLNKTTSSMSLTTKAFQKADSGMEYLLYKINKVPPAPSNVGDLCNSFNNATKKCTINWFVSGQNMSAFVFFLDDSKNVLDDGDNISNVQYIDVIGEVVDGSNKVSRTVRADVLPPP